MSAEGEKVVVNVYDLSQGLARQLSATLLGKVIDGIWHTGVAVYGTEFYFGGGIQRAPVGHTIYGKPSKVIELGHTQVPQEIFEEYLKEITPRYTAETYNVLYHNCNNFSEDIAQFLVGSGIPQYILGLPNEIMNSPMGGMLMPMIMQLETTLRNNQAPRIPHQISSGQRSDALHNFAAPQFSSAGISVRPLSSDSGRMTRPVEDPSNGVTARMHHATSTPTASIQAEEAQKTDSSNIQKKSSEVKIDSLGQARAQVQEEITSEFVALMASGGLRASEAAALAARRVMERHGIGSVGRTQG